MVLHELCVRHLLHLTIQLLCWPPVCCTLFLGTILPQELTGRALPCQPKAAAIQKLNQLAGILSSKYNILL